MGLLLCNCAVSAAIPSSFEFNLNENVVDRFPFSCNVKQAFSKEKGGLPSNITFLAADVKFDGEKLKILEFQDGPTAGLRAYDYVVGKKGEVWQRFWDKIMSFGKPVWYVAPRLVSAVEGVFDHDDKEHVRFNEFLANGGRYVKTLDSLVREAQFKKVAGNGVKTVKKNNKLTLESCKGIVMVKLIGLEKDVARFKKSYPDFLVINERGRESFFYKYAMDNAFKDFELESFRPWSGCYNKIYDSKLAAKIIKDHDAEAYVIKPISASRSNGVILTCKENLDKKLKKILTTPRAAPGETLGELSSLTYDYWKFDNEKSFFIEEFVPSKNIEVNGRPYDPTARMVFVLTYDQGVVGVQFLKSFWKFSVKALDEQGSLIDKHVSRYHQGIANLIPEDIAINDKDLSLMQEQMMQAIVPFYIGTLVSR